MTNAAPDAPPPAETNAYAPPEAPLPDRPPPAVTGEVTLAQRIAGGLLIFHAVMLFVEAAVMPDTPGADRLFSPTRNIVPAIIDLGIGISLISKVRALLRWAVVRVGLGLVGGTLLLATRDPVLAVMQAAMCVAFLLFLVGDAGKPRMAVGGALFGMYVFVNVLGIASTVTGKNPIAALASMARDDIESTPAGVVRGDAVHYELRAPSDRWYLRKPSAAKKDNPLADRWLTRPDLDAHVMVIVEKVPGALVLPDPLMDASIDAARGESTAYEILGREPLRSNPDEGRIVHTRSTSNGIAIESLQCVVASYEVGIQIFAFAPQASFPDAEKELRAIVESFALPTDREPGLPADVEATPVGTITGLSAAYTLKAPEGRWFLRDDAVAKKENPLVDRWLVRPDKDTHVLVVAEYVPGAVLDLDRYADAVIGGLTDNQQAKIVSRVPLRTNPTEARLVRAVVVTPQMTLDYYYGLFTRGDRAFQVIGFARSEIFPRVEAELLQAIESFEMPPAK